MFLTPGVTGNQFATYINGSPRLAQVSIIDGSYTRRFQRPDSSRRPRPRSRRSKNSGCRRRCSPPNMAGAGAPSTLPLSRAATSSTGTSSSFPQRQAGCQGVLRRRQGRCAQNNFGGSIGGPIVKNKFFFLRHLRPLPAPGRSGDARYGDAAGRSLPPGRFRAASHRAEHHHLRSSHYCARRSRGLRPYAIFEQQDPGEPPQRIYSKVAPLLPPTDTNALVNNFVSRGESPTNDDAFMYKLDYHIDDDHRISFSHWYSWFRTTKNIDGHGLVAAPSAATRSIGNFRTRRLAVASA